MKIWDGVLAQNLAECQGKDAVVLSWNWAHLLGAVSMV